MDALIIGLKVCENQTLEFRYNLEQQDIPYNDQLNHQSYISCEIPIWTPLHSMIWDEERESMYCFDEGLKSPIGLYLSNVGA